MAFINTVETEGVQAGLAAAPPLATVDIWQSLDPTRPFALQTTGINQLNGLTNQIGTHNAFGLSNAFGSHLKFGVSNTFGGKFDLGFKVDAIKKKFEATPKWNAASPFGKYFGKLDVAGLFTVGSTAVCLAPCSDQRSKKNIEPLDNCLDKVLSLRSVRFDWDENVVPKRANEESTQIGLIAQEVEKIVPEVVREEIIENQYLKSIRYENLTAILIEAVKEQQKQIEDLKQTVQELSTKLADCCQ